MAKPKAERWLTEAFAQGVAERDPATCWLAQHDHLRRPCEGRAEIFHFIPRQRVENAMSAQLRWSAIYEVLSSRVTECVFRELSKEECDELILLAAWDPRNGGIGCEHHHRRFDGHRHSPENPKIIVPEEATPGHLREFVADYGLWTPFEERFPAVPVAS